MEQALSKPIEKFGVQPIYDVLRETLQGDTPIGKETLDAISLLLASHLSKISQEPSISYYYLGYACQALGAFVENGANADALADYFAPLITALIPQIFNTRESFYDQLKTKLPEQEKEEIKQRLERDINGSLKPLELATAAILSRSPKARMIIRQDENFLATCSLLRWEYPFLYKVTHILDYEEIIILEVYGKWGLRGRISGISGNYQLLSLLSHYVGQWEKEIHPMLPQEWIDCYLGVGAIDRAGIMEFNWQPRLWTALCDQETFYIEPEHHILGGGSPADIMPCPAIDGKRVILWTPPDEDLAIHVGRDFEGLSASFNIVEILSLETVEKYREQIIHISDDQRQKALQLHEVATNQSLF